MGTIHIVLAFVLISTALQVITVVGLFNLMTEFRMLAKAVCQYLSDKE